MQRIEPGGGPVWYPRYVGLDVHKEYVLVGAMDAGQNWMLRPRRVAIGKMAGWLEKHLRETDAVVLESTSNAWVLHDEIAPRVAKVVVANPLKVRQIAEGRVKTDKRDLKHLLILLIGGLVPEVWVPPGEVRELRALLSHRTRLNKQLTMAKNRVHSFVHRFNLQAPADVFAEKNRGWWEAQGFSATLSLQVSQDLAQVDQMLSQREAVDAELIRLSLTDRWREIVILLTQLPGVGTIVAMTLVSAIGEIARFPTAKKLVGYAGLGAGVHQSGKKQRGKRITKEGRKELRWGQVQAARVAARTDPYWKGQFTELCQRMHPNQAYVALARRMLVVVWHVWTKREARRGVSPESVAVKMLRWAGRLPLEALGGLTRSQFAKYCLLQLGVEAELIHVWCGQKHPRRLPSTAEFRQLAPRWALD